MDASNLGYSVDTLNGSPVAALKSTYSLQEKSYQPLVHLPNPQKLALTQFKLLDKVVREIPKYQVLETLKHAS